MFITPKFKQFWKEAPSSQKALLGGGLIGIIGMIWTMMFFFNPPQQHSLFPAQQLTLEDRLEIESVLDRKHIPFKENSRGEVLLSDQQIPLARQELKQYGWPKKTPEKGLDLLDAKHWMKGEREFSTLELRALKGQLENELMNFEDLLQAHIFFPFQAEKWMEEPRVSILVGLKQGREMTSSLLYAISSHVASAFVGLRPQSIAVSDMQGMVYQTFEGEQRVEEKKVESYEKIKEALLPILDRWNGEKNFSYHFIYPESKRQRRIDLLLIAEDQFTGWEKMENELEKECQKWGAELKMATFKKNTQKPSFAFFRWVKANPKVAWGLFVLFVTGIFYGLFRKIKRKKKPQETSEVFSNEQTAEWIGRVLNRIPLNTISSSLREEDPHSLSLLLSHLDPNKAESILSTFSDGLQEAVLWHLKSLEKKDI